MGKTKDIRAAVEAELSFDPLVDSADIAVRNLNGEVALNGTVPSYPQYLEAAAADQAVNGLVGVRTVRDNIEIGYNADPVDLDLHVQEALDRSALVPDDSDVDVDTSGNVVKLTGHVRTWAEHDAVVGAAWMANGVLEVRDDLSITG
jgi:osmotically-inducible protein OsmY